MKQNPEIPAITIIIPAYNEAEGIEKLVTYLKESADESVMEILVSDAGSEDATVAVAEAAGATVLLSPQKGRAAQMNYGASAASGDILYFVHADCLPPKTFAADIRAAIAGGFDLGRYRTAFDSSKMLLKLNAWATRFDFFLCMGGDQTLFIRKDLFNAIGGFNRDMRIMEEFEFCIRARKQGRYKIIQKNTLVSARKYEHNSWWQVQRANAAIVRMYKRGAGQQEMLDKYREMLRYRKNAFD